MGGQQRALVQLGVRRREGRARMRSEESPPGRDNLKAKIGVGRRGAGGGGRVSRVEGTAPVKSSRTENLVP